jgi:hypothetical protein
MHLAPGPPNIVKYKRLFKQMAEGLHAIRERVLQLLKEASTCTFKYKEKNLGML